MIRPTLVLPCLVLLIAPTLGQDTYLKPTNSQTADDFGHAISVDGDTVAVAAPGMSGFSQQEAVHIFRRVGSSWIPDGILAMPTPDQDDFGFSVSIDGDTVVVGAHLDDSNATGVNGDRNNNSALNSGAAYVFVRNGTSWDQQAYLKASNNGAGDFFGRSVAISGDTIVVTAGGGRLQRNRCQRESI